MFEAGLYALYQAARAFDTPQESGGRCTISSNPAATISRTAFDTTGQASVSQ